MDRSRTNHADSVMAQLKGEPWRFSLEQCVRILEAEGETPELRGDLGLAFSPAEVSSLDNGSLQVRSLGPGGADGVLPYGWLEWLQQAAQDKNGAPQDFIHLFQQRFIQHHCRSLSVYRLATPYARRDCAPGLVVMRSLCGFDTDAMKKRESAQIPNLLAHSGGLARRRRSTAGFVALVAAVLRITVNIEEFVGRWQPLPLASQSRTGCRLGRDSVAGRRVWNQHAALRVRLLAKDAAQWRAFLPGGPGFVQLKRLGDIWFGAGITLELMMRGTLTLDNRLRRAAPPRLGYTAQLTGRKPASFRCQQYLEENNTWI
ncbi:type VI secretion system baseplate subunit TssG [Citrobacter amalonaticus]|uniref:Type VI secretion system baseplate subunit TssG n=1 Tax=Citrobacter amalonaticus TaxID=35703 RepID=A0A2S4RXN3_CITAM|nr:type VI secretion system baseplate subunit TssG [Citrobacter amalonaticus]POT56134.1 type VI secretion system baseplate subunit TssG [Citrobacter amalonaticus]POT74443.1 type VI secretion system baseplate subunit TssG [Citrobacter amalonaticus]POU65242.1 type VI secretion system baseplate subunit TssG [Citrobacter amalonaticus]POV04077.1 type VI secretion system baseplate subunit TssG [Citrobacter amalonaticus]